MRYSLLVLTVIAVHRLSGMDVFDDLPITKSYEHTIDSGTHIHLDFTAYPKNIIITSVPIEQQKPKLMAESLLRNSVYQKINKTVYKVCYTLVSKILSLKDAYQRPIELRAVYDKHTSTRCREAVLKKEEFCINFSQDNATVTIKPLSNLPLYYELLVPSDSSLTVMNNKDIIFKTALGEITYQEKDDDHPLYQKGQITVNNIPYAYYPLPIINLFTKKGSILIKKMGKKKLDDRAGTQN